MAIRLTDLDTPLDSVILPSGREVAVLPANGAVAQLREDYERGNVTALWEIIAHLVPDATPEEIKSLRVAHCLAILRIATGKSDEILAEIKEEAEKRAKEGNPKATTGVKPKVRRRGTGSAS